MHVLHWGNDCSIRDACGLHRSGSGLQILPASAYSTHPFHPCHMRPWFLAAVELPIAGNGPAVYARQRLFSAYVHTQPWLQITSESVFAGREIPWRVNLTRAWGQPTLMQVRHSCAGWTSSTCSAMASWSTFLYSWKPLLLLSVSTQCKVTLCTPLLIVFEWPAACQPRQQRRVSRTALPCSPISCSLQAARLLLRAALIDPLNLWFVLLSESTIPLVPAPLVWAQLLSERHSRVDACRDVDMDPLRWASYAFGNGQGAWLYVAAAGDYMVLLFLTCC
jgi:hypothetical protein